MGSRLFGVLLFSIFLVVVFSLAPPTGKKTLVLLGKETLKTTHSEFFDALKAKGFRLTFNSVDNDNLNLQKYGEYLYDHLIIFASSEEFGAIDVDSVLRFIDSGNNLLLATDSEISDSVRELALECGVEFDEQQTAVIDHFNYDSQDDGKHTLILAKQAVEATVIFDTPNPVLFRGVGFSLMDNNALIIPLLSGHSTSFSHALDKPVTNLHSAGKNTVLVAALQARNNARVVISGSIELFSNEFFQSTVKSSREGHVPSGNSDFALDVTLWAFQQKGVLQASDAVHHKLSGSETAGYRIKDTVEYQVKIKEWKDNEWVPFKAEDVQLEFVRLDPYIRTFLKHDNNGLFSTSFVIPDVLGVYTFRLVHNRLGYSYLKLADSIPVRPFRHNEYERFIPAAFPYYASAFSMMFGFSLFSCFFLYHRSEKVKTA